MNDPVAWIVASIPVALALYLWIAASLSAVFRKAGEEPWQAWVPILNAIVLLRLGGMSGWFLLLALVPILGTLALLGVFIIVYVRLNRSFGVGPGMTVVAVLLFPVWTSILGWGPARWLGDRRDSAGGPMRRGEADFLDARVTGRSGGAQPSYSPVYSPAPIDGTAPVSRSQSPNSAEPFVPPRPPAPAAAGGPLGGRTAYAASARPGDAPAEQWSFAPPPAVQYGSGPPGTPTFRSTAVGVNPAFEDMDDDGTGGALFAPTPPVSSVPRVEGDGIAGGDGAEGDGAAGADRWAPPAAAAPVEAPVPMRRASWAPSPGERVSEPGVWGGAPREQRFDTSAEVSAVHGAPTLGEPLAARGSVSAQHDVPELPDAESAFDETIIAVRRRPTWMLTPPLGAPIAVTSDALIIGRRPSADPDFPDAQLVPISDETRTMSKTHARLELLDDEWVIVDLDSTNGVVLFRDDGTETEATPGVPQPVGERFLLGDAELRIARADTR
ncbi:DUF5684 domain-containing protein [Microbacterium sp. DT81.1]|uniref:DUF5684 domain-containing protein n=1 Tax=Microbacterium sp. DT81.1 TaxID=3393413 RepID=UPI003CF15BB2